MLGTHALVSSLLASSLFISPSISTLEDTYHTLEEQEHLEKEKIYFEKSLTNTMIVMRSPIFLKNDTSGYKNQRLEEIQNYALAQGVEEWKIKTMLAWFYQENGALDEKKRGDGGKSVGLCQCHTYWRRKGKDNYWTNEKGEKINGCPLTYEAQREQCVRWFIRDTKNSTESTLIRDIRKGHNPASRTYENEIRKKLSLFI